jgi:hypothetical protein
MRLQKSRLEGGFSSEWIEATLPPKYYRRLPTVQNFYFLCHSAQLKAFFFLTWRLLYGQEI